MFQVLYRGGLSLVKLYARALSTGKALADLKSNSIDQGIESSHFMLKSVIQ